MSSSTFVWLKCMYRDELQYMQFDCTFDSFLDILIIVIKTILLLLEQVRFPLTTEHLHPQEVTIGDPLDTKVKYDPYTPNQRTCSKRWFITKKDISLELVAWTISAEVESCIEYICILYESEPKPKVSYFHHKYN